MNGSVVAAARFAAGLPRFLATPLTPDGARAQVVRQLAQRADAFLGLLARAVYARPDGVYARLLARAGLGLGDVTALVARCGVEDALAEMYHRGVYLTLEEFKGRRPIVRDGQLAVAKTMRATLSCDHRVLNGVEGGRFLEELKGILENPVTLLLE